MEMPTLETFLGFSAIASFASFIITQIAKKSDLPPRIILLGLSVVGGIIYWGYFFIPEVTRLWIAGAVATIYAGGNLIYKILEKFFPEISSKYTGEK